MQQSGHIELKKNDHIGMVSNPRLYCVLAKQVVPKL